MIRHLLVLALLVFVAACGRSNDGLPDGRPPLWAIEDSGGETVGWLFGTIHALPSEARWSSPQLDRAVDGAGGLVVEVRNLDPVDIGRLIQRMARDEPVPPLADRVSPADWQRIETLLRQEALKPNAYDGLETWAVALALGRLGQSSTHTTSADGEILRRFAGRPVAELEGAAEQLGIFDAMPERDQRTLLAAILAERDAPEAEPNALAKAWLAGDTAAIERASTRGILADPALHRTLATDRNAAWADRIAPLLESKRKPLIAVGTAHMLGPDGLPALLAARGYRVTRIQ